ncbi:uncharacterized protein LOC116847984 [Odontomachus brunneus]|uniref:uncharacterized protein LOC116847984 n=1 Tax=Odontomachus brunneus TaxID=486640 RepID=UPI0013F2034F|nr:uncharacterized protein LOC116847984 [Odontomachus brunneus]
MPQLLTTPEQLIHANEWWEGPKWLKENENSWPKEDEELSINAPEERKKVVIAAAITERPIIDYKRFSSFNKLLRVTAYVLRFSVNVKCKTVKRELGPITNVEINKAKCVIVKLVQAEVFEEEIKALRNNAILRTSRLIALCPYLDEEEVLRVGGRLKHAVLPEEVKHLVLLPVSHYFTSLIILHYHEKLLHAGAQATTNSIREEFWPIFARSRVKEILRNCVKCRKASPKPS